MGINAGELRKMLYDMAKAEPKRRFHSLYDKVYRMDILEEAWKSVRSNRGSPGVDGMSIGDAESEQDSMLSGLHSDLKEGTYIPSPLKRVYIPKAGGKKRGLAIPTVRDRIIQTAVKMIIEPIFEAQFEPYSFGFRPGKSTHNAVNEVAKYLNYGCEHVIDADIRGCFDNIPRNLLMDQISKRISDGAILRLIRQIIDAGIMENNEIISMEKGTPQGSPLSPLLANIFLDQLDKAWRFSGLRRGSDAHLIRYADDIVIIVGGDACKAMDKFSEIISSLGLQLSEEKTRIVKSGEGFDFLGFHFVRHFSPMKGKKVTRWFPSPKSENSIRERIREVTGRNRLAVTSTERAKEILIPIIKGWGNYFAYSTDASRIHSIWDYAQVRLMRMHCNQHNVRSEWRYRDIGKRHLSLMEYFPEMLNSKSHKPYHESSR